MFCFVSFPLFSSLSWWSVVVEIWFHFFPFCESKKRERKKSKKEMRNSKECVCERERERTFSFSFESNSGSMLVGKTLILSFSTVLSAAKAKMVSFCFFESNDFNNRRLLSCPCDSIKPPSCFTYKY